jgi:hypothetical protein
MNGKDIYYASKAVRRIYTNLKRVKRIVKKRNRKSVMRRGYIDTGRV